jgi:hypothetical protein
MASTSQQLTGQSRLSEVLKLYPDAWRRLSNSYPIFSHLHSAAGSPMAGAVWLQDLAHVAGLPLEAVIEVITSETARAAGPAFAPADDAAFPEEQGAIRLDVRPMIAAGQEPFASVMKAAAQVGQGGTLLLEAPFDPAPLRRVLARKGFVSQGRKLAEDHWRIAFRRGAAPAAVPAPPPPGVLWSETDGAHLDVRGLEAPQPMVQILALIDAGALNEFTVHHERDPVFLYPELEERGWGCRIVAEVPGEVRLKLSRRK